MKILVANRGEIAVRILRTAAELNIPAVAVYSEDDVNSLHTRRADEVHSLAGKSVDAYLDIDQLISAAREHDCTAIHPGYGFLSENAEFSNRCSEEGITFIGPSTRLLELFGDKTRAREIARRCDVPLLPGTSGPTGMEEARGYFTSLGEKGAIVIKALAGGGGRGIRVVYDIAELDEMFDLCRSEALAAFGNGDVYVERFLKNGRHIEVQVVGDGTGDVVHLGERECSLQRRNQKLVEIAPSPALSERMCDRITDAAVRMAREVDYNNLGTFEFLVDADAESDDTPFFFIEVNPRLQVEHTVTEEVTDIDLVKTQIEIAAGRSLKELGLRQSDMGSPTGYAMQVRVNMEQMGENGVVCPSQGVLSAFDAPLGRGVRVDTFGYTGYATNPNFDSLLAKLICYSRSSNYAEVVSKTYRALCEFRIEGVETNIPFLLNLLKHPDVEANRVTTSFIEENIDRLVDTDGTRHKRLHFTDSSIADHTKGSAGEAPEDYVRGPENSVPVSANMQGVVVSVDVVEGDRVNEKRTIAIVESMKMQHIVKANVSGVVRLICVAKGDSILENQPLMFIEPMEIDASEADDETETDPSVIRPDLAEVIARRNMLLDEARPEAVERRRKTGQRTARENIADLVDPDSFIEYGSFAVAAQRSRLSMDKLIEKSPADGLIAGMGAINGGLFDDSRSRCMVLSYDYMAMAGTQGAFNHKKMDRMLDLAEKWRLPVTLFAEGGGGRPGDTDAHMMMVAGLDVITFRRYAGLSGLVPLVGIVSGRCYAGNAALLGCSDVIIATKNSNIGMGGPAMIEGGGLGECKPEDIGPIDVQSPNGVVDIVVEDEAEAVSKAKLYLSYFQGSLSDWDCEDQRLLRLGIPENRLRAYDIRKIINILADKGSILELRREFGIGMITALIRIEGVPFGLIANNPLHLGGAIDAEAADKAARFMQLCDAFDIPLVSLSDTPGFMVGPEAEKNAQVRRFSHMFVTAAGITIPIFSIVVRKGYGLGAQAMVGDSYQSPFFNVAWPTGEFGGMGLEGAIKLGFKKELEAIDDPETRQEAFNNMVSMAYAHGKAINMAAFLEIDNVIDPKDSRHWIMRGLRSLPPPERRNSKKRPNIDAW